MTNQLTTFGDGRDINEDNEEIPEWARPYIRTLKQQVTQFMDALGRGGIHQEVEAERLRQMTRWSAEHDKLHEGFEWLGLIATYAANGRYIAAAALCEAAEEAKRAKSA